MAFNVTLSKNNINIIVHTAEVNDNWKNKLFLITPPTAPANQQNGPVTPKIINLLRLTHQLVVRGALVADTTSTVLQVKQNFIDLVKGAGTNGGTVTMTYEGYNDGITGHIEDVSFTEKSADVSNESSHLDYAKYDVQFTFVEGTDAFNRS